MPYTKVQRKFYDRLLIHMPEDFRKRVKEQHDEIEQKFARRYIGKAMDRDGYRDYADIEERMFLPCVTTNDEAECLYESISLTLEEFCPPEILSPRFINPVDAENFRIAKENFFKSCLLFLSEYVRNKDDDLWGLVYVLVIASQSDRRNSTTIYEGFIHQLRHGIKLCRDEMTRQNYETYTSFTRSSDGRSPSDKRSDGERGFLTHQDSTLRCYETYRHAVQRLKDSGCEVDIPRECRLAFSYLGFLKVFVELGQSPETKRSFPEEGARFIMADEIVIKTRELHKQYCEALRRNRSLGLFERLKIESYFKFLNDPSAPQAQKLKYLPLLEGCVGALEVHQGAKPAKSQYTQLNFNDLEGVQFHE